MDQQTYQELLKRKNELLQLSFAEIQKLTIAERYERYRFIRETQANEYVRLYQLGLPQVEAMKRSKAYCDQLYNCDTL